MIDVSTTSLTAADLEAQLQRRVARLLLRHDRRTFRGHFRELFSASTLPQPEYLRAYDAYMTLIMLAGELLDEIVPRIRRQMSFQATRETLDEEPPLRGQIDWPTSLARAWNERPDQPPTRFTTTVRSRSFATPANRLVVAVLHSYAQALKRMRTQSPFVDAPLTAGEQHELVQLEDRVRRSLATTHFRALARDAHTYHIPSRIATVEKHLRPGKNAYRDLIAWWRRFEQLHLRYGSSPQTTRVLDDETKLSVLYQIWIALELVEFLAENNELVDPHIQTDQLRITFTWQGRQFRLVYDRQPTAHLAWEGAPGERPDYFITRADPLVIKDKQTNQTIWHEPGVLLDAKCFTGQQPDRATGAIKRMLADLQLVDAIRGVLLLPDTANLSTQRLYPKPDRYLGSIDPAMEVHLHAVRPMEQIDTLYNHLRALLDQVVTWLPKRPPIACHGFLQDVDTINPGGTQPRRCPDSNEVLVICPKPHISEWRIDFVSPIKDCLKNPQLCHIISTDKPVDVFPPFIRRVQTREQLIGTINQLRERLQGTITEEDETPEADAARSQLINAIGELADTYVQWRKPDTLHIKDKLMHIFGPYWRQSSVQTHGIPEEVQHMLISGEYVWGEFPQSTIEDWAACAVQYVRALERELRRLIYEPCGTILTNKYKKEMKSRDFTFGTPSYIYSNRCKEQKENWQVLLTTLLEPRCIEEDTFGQLLMDIDKIRSYRNQIAHGEPTDQVKAEEVRAEILGRPNEGKVGLLLRLVEMLDAPVPTASS